MTSSKASASLRLQQLRVVPHSRDCEVDATPNVPSWYGHGGPGGAVGAIAHTVAAQRGSGARDATHSLALGASHGADGGCIDGDTDRATVRSRRAARLGRHGGAGGGG